MSTLLSDLNRATGRNIVSVEQEDDSLVITDAQGHTWATPVASHNGMASVIEAAAAQWPAEAQS